MRIVAVPVSLESDRRCLHCWLMGAIAAFGDGEMVLAHDAIRALETAIAQVLASSPQPRETVDATIAGLPARVAARAERYRCQAAAPPGSALQ